MSESSGWTPGNSILSDHPCPTFAHFMEQGFELRYRQRDSALVVEVIDDKTATANFTDYGDRVVCENIWVKDSLHSKDVGPTICLFAEQLLEKPMVRAVGSDTLAFHCLCAKLEAMKLRGEGPQASRIGGDVSQLDSISSAAGKHDVTLPEYLVLHAASTFVTNPGVVSVFITKTVVGSSYADADGMEMVNACLAKGWVEFSPQKMLVLTYKGMVLANAIASELTIPQPL